MWDEQGTETVYQVREAPNDEQDPDYFWNEPRLNGKITKGEKPKSPKYAHNINALFMEF